MAKDNANMQDQATSTDNRYFESLRKLSQAANRAVARGERKRKVREGEENHTYHVIETDSGGMILSTETGELVVQGQDMVAAENQVTEGVEETAVYHIVTDNMLPTDSQYETTVFALNKDSDRIENTLKLNIQGQNQTEELGHENNPVMDTGQGQPNSAQDMKVMNEEEATPAYGTVVSLQDTIPSTNESNVHQSPRRSRRVSKPTPRLQQFHELQELHGNQLKRVRQEIINIIPDGLVNPGMVDIMHVEHMQVEDTRIPSDGEGPDGEHGEEATDVTTIIQQAHEVKMERTEQEEAAVRLLSLADHIVQKEQSFEVMEEEVTESTHDILEDMDDIDQTRPRRDNLARRTPRKSTSSMIQIGPGKYQCDTCSFSTNKVRQMSAHIKLHKLENNTCYYCEARFDSKEILADHMSQHKGPVPFFCHVCSMRFKSRTLLNMHLPKHSDDKPFICHVCSMGFKWKHALKCHMITHSNKKEHLCDICGYATAHKSQLKAHRKIHSGDTLKCHYPDCGFLATKSQNMKYHVLTHTKEKPHQCDMCGQNFSLVKNLRRHLLLHNTDTKQTCIHCTFSSTRVDKLKEHLLKMHGIGTPPERRLRVTDLVKHQLNPAVLRMARAAAAQSDGEITQTAEAVEAAEIVDGQVVEEDEILESSVAVVKVEAQLLEEQRGEEVSVHQISQLRQALSTQVSGETTLIEIIQEDGQPMRILRNQSILVAPHSEQPGGTHILEQVPGQVQEFAEVVQIGTSDSGGLVLTDPMETTITTIPQSGTTSADLITRTSSNSIRDVQVGRGGLMVSQVVTAVPEGQMITEGQIVTAEGQMMTAEGQMVTTEGQMVTAEGQIVTAEGQMVTAEGQMVTTDGQMVTAEGQMVTAEGQMVTAEGQMVTAEGQIVTAVPQGLEIHKIHDLDGEHVTYAEMVEVPVDQVSGYVHEGDV